MQKIILIIIILLNLNLIVMFFILIRTKKIAEHFENPVVKVTLKFIQTGLDKTKKCRGKLNMCINE